MSMKIIFFETESGSVPVIKFLNSLQKRDKAVLIAALDDLRLNGMDKSSIIFRQIEGKLWELKISSNRVFYIMIEASVMILLHAYKKQSQKAPKKELDTAKKRMAIVLEERKNDKKKY